MGKLSTDRPRPVHRTWRRFAPSIAAVVVLAVICGGAIASWDLLNLSRNHDSAASTATELTVELQHSFEYSQILASGASLTPVLAATNRADELDVRNSLRSLKAAGFEPADTSALNARANDYLAALDRQVHAAGLGQAAQVRALEAQIAVVYHSALQSSEDTVADRRLSADQAYQGAQLGIGIVGAVLLASVGGVVWWDGRRRRAIATRHAERRSQTRFESMVENGSDLMALTDRAGRIIYISPTIQHLLGFEPAALVGRVLMELVDIEDRPVVVGLLDRVLASGSAGPTDCPVHHSSGSDRIIEATAVDLSAVEEVGGLLWSARDVTERRKLEADLERSAFSDSLTGLANRALFRDRLGHAVARHVRDEDEIAVLLADLDGFKAINDSFGHDVGDGVLIEVGARFQRCVRTGDTIARLGGDEFTILLENSDDPVDPSVIAERMLEILHLPIRVGEREFRVSASVGIASLNVGDGAQDLLRNADTAMYAAKTNGRGRLAVFEPAMHAKALEQLRLSIDLDDALERDQLEVHYQPTLSLATGELLGTEALVRWRHPERGLVSPDLFIPIAERGGQIHAIGLWVLRQACRQSHRWQEQYPTHPARSMSVNVSGHQLAEPGLVGDVESVLRETGIDPETLVLEITETVLMHDVDTIRQRLVELKSLGVRLAIDDFGTGYSSLAYLRQFPVDILKIDRSFVEAASSGVPGGDALVQAIVDLSNSLHLKTIAEGIETEQQADHMLAIGCPIGQGFLFARPLLPEDVEPLLAEGRIVPAAAVHH
jgi:diguanylate cyclase (GGDEF)-like protein/PAS domain S-box-containing protein